MPHPRTDHSNRPGIALIITIGAVAVAFVIGISVVSSLPAATRASANLIDRQQAIYLAESGLHEALARLRQPPPGQSLWAGATARSVTGLPGTYDVTITKIDDNQYRIDSVGHAPASSSRPSVTHNLHMIVNVEIQQPGYVMPGATVMGASGYLAGSINFNGDAAVVGTVYNFGHVKGNLIATGAAMNISYGYVDGTIKSNATVASPPSIDLTGFAQYYYNGLAYQAQVVQPADLNTLPSTLQPVTQSNPLGVVVVAGDMTLPKDITIDNGILVVQGNLVLGSRKLEVRGRPSYFSLMVNGNLIYQNSAQLNIQNGPAYLKGSLSPSGITSSVSLQFKAGLVSLKSLPLSFSGYMEIDSPPSDGGDPSSPTTINVLTTPIGSASAAYRTVSPVSYYASVQP